jgi:FKBP-type peptidyl-prolyl cis-trans isomerase 2
MSKRFNLLRLSSMGRRAPVEDRFRFSLLFKGGQRGFFQLIILAGLALCLCGVHFGKAYAAESEPLWKETAPSEPERTPRNCADAAPASGATQVMDAPSTGDCTGAASVSGAASVQEDPSKVQEGDFVELNYTISLEDGSLLSTNIPDVAKDKARKKAAQYVEQQTFSAERVIPGQPTPLVGLRDAFIGMEVKEKRRIVLSPEKAYGERDLRNIQQIPCAKIMPKTVSMSPEDWMKNFKFFPVAGKEFWLNPFFPARIVEVTEQEVLLEFRKEGQIPESELGSVSVSMDDNNVTLTLTPVIGAHFGSNGQDGRITESDGKQFTVDFNNPLAGKSLVLDMEIVSLTKKSAFTGMEISWLEDHDKGLEVAARENKPMVLVLYSDGCPWCKRLMNQFRDVRIRTLKDRFVWVKVNSEKEVKYRKLYGQKGYPTIVFLDSKGQVLKEDGSYLPGPVLGRELDFVLSGGTPAEAVPQSLFSAGISENPAGRLAQRQNPPWPPSARAGEALSSLESYPASFPASRIGRSSF